MKQILHAIAAGVMVLSGCAGNSKGTADNANEKEAQKAPYYEAFSHNDYSRERPLLQAFELGFNCVEADC